jgi:hypothetical protein
MQEEANFSFFPLSTRAALSIYYVMWLLSSYDEGLPSFNLYLTFESKELFSVSH